MKGYKLWDLILRKTMYSEDVLFIKFRETYRTEGLKWKITREASVLAKGKKKDSTELTKLYEEVEQPTLAVRRSDQVRN
jgi:hypothetical protein